MRRAFSEGTDLSIALPVPAGDCAEDSLVVAFLAEVFLAAALWDVGSEAEDGGRTNNSCQEKT